MRRVVLSFTLSPSPAFLLLLTSLSDLSDLSVHLSACVYVWECVECICVSDPFGLILATPSLLIPPSDACGIAVDDEGGEKKEEE